MTSSTAAHPLASCDHWRKLDHLGGRVLRAYQALLDLVDGAACGLCRQHFREAQDLFGRAVTSARRSSAARPAHHPGLCCRAQTRYAYLCNELRAGRHALLDAAEAFERAGDSLRAWTYRAAWRAVAE